MRILLFAITIPLWSAMAQQRNDTITGLIRAAYLEDRDLVLRTYAKGYTLDHPDDKPSAKPQSTKGWRYSIAFHAFYSLGKDLISIDPNTRSAYLHTGDSIMLLDSIPHPKMTIAGQIFQRDSGIYLLGGYGLWSARQSFLVLDHPYMKWRPVRIQKHEWSNMKSDFPPALFEHNVVQDNSSIWVFYGKTVNVVNPLDMPGNEEVWAFDFNREQWSFYGDLNRDVFHEAPETYTTLQVGQRQFMMPDDRAIVEINAPENKLHLYESTPFSREVKSSEEILMPVFFRNGKIYFHKRMTPPAHLAMSEWQTEYRSGSIEQFLGSDKGETFFYESFRQRWAFLFYILAALGAAATLMLFLRYRKKSVVHLMTLTETGISFRNQTHDLDPLTHAVLKKLLDVRGPVSSTDLLQIVENPNLKYAHNNRVKNTIIRQLNLQLKSILNERHDLITSFASEDDKRFRWYRIDQSKFTN